MVYKTRQCSRAIEDSALQGKVILNCDIVKNMCIVFLCSVPD